MNNVTTSDWVYMQYINNPAQYMATHEKKYISWVCIPHSSLHGRVVTNKFTGQNFTLTKQNCVIWSGSQGEQQVISLARLSTYCELANGMPIPLDTLRRTLNEKGYVDWMRIMVKTSITPVYACFVPAHYQFEMTNNHGEVRYGNAKGIEHGRGDFVMAMDKEGMPALQNRWIVNGTVFINKYDNRGFKDFLDVHYRIKGTPPKPTDINFV